MGPSAGGRDPGPAAPIEQGRAMMATQVSKALLEEVDVVAEKQPA
jgi:hypothetical protein